MTTPASVTLPTSGSTSWYAHYSWLDSTARYVGPLVDTLAAGLAVTSSQSGTTYTLALADSNTVVELTNAAAVTVTVPLNSAVALPVGTSIVLRQFGAGQVTAVGASGVTLLSRGAALKTAGQYAELVLTKRATDSWIVSGDITT